MDGKVDFSSRCASPETNRYWSGGGSKLEKARPVSSGVLVVLILREGRLQVPELEHIAIMAECK